MLDRTIGLEDRRCENCRGRDLEVLWRQVATARTRAANYRFDCTDVICRNCGFVFVSPVYRQSDLLDYYGDSYAAFQGAAPDYSIEKRLQFLDRLGVRGGIFVEVGANLKTDFHRQLATRCEKVVTVEVNDSVSSDLQSLAGLPDGTVDYLAHYFVLEHIPRVSEFLADCCRVLKPGGLMVIEVPDVALYPTDPSSLQLHEHTSHFSQRILRDLVERLGFEIISTGRDDCSRSFGFVAAFRKTDRAQGASQSQFGSEYDANRASFMAGVARLEALGEAMDAAYSRLAALLCEGGKALLWAANDLLAMFLDRHPVGAGVTIIDSNPDKARFFTLAPVLVPEGATEKIRAADDIFIFTNFHAPAILTQIEMSSGKRFAPNRVHIVDPFGVTASGEQ